MRLVCMSDSHNQHDQVTVPDGDVFVHAGDFSFRGEEGEVRAFAEFVRGLPHRHKLVIAGNHELTFERKPADAESWLGGSCTYLLNSGVMIDGVSFWGSPYTPRFYDWAFNLDRGAELKRVWSRIPAKTQVLITHGPPRGILDDVGSGRHEGCDDLLAAVERLRPKLHLFGHIHEGAGSEVHGPTQFVNASILDGSYQLVAECTVVDL